MYTVVNSNAYFDEAYAAATATPGWLRTTYTLDAVVIVLLIAAEVLALRGAKKKKHEA